MDGVVHYSNYSNLSGYKVLRYDQMGGKEYHRPFSISDDGNTWNEKDTDIDPVYPHMFTSISVLN